MNRRVGWTAEPVSRLADPVHDLAGSGAGWRVAVDLQAPTRAAGFAPVIACSYPVTPFPALACASGRWRQRAGQQLPHRHQPSPRTMPRPGVKGPLPPFAVFAGGVRGPLPPSTIYRGRGPLTP